MLVWSQPGGGWKRYGNGAGHGMINGRLLLCCMILMKRVELVGGRGNYDTKLTVLAYYG